MIAQAIKTFLETPGHCRDNGICASFVRIANGWGIKMYWSREDRDETYRQQKYAAHFGLAPKVGQKMVMEHEGEYRYGYLTECVDKLMVEEMGLGTWRRSEEHKQLDRDLTDIGFNLILGFSSCGEITDLHARNVGRLPDGRIVCIDFSHSTLDDEYTKE